MATPACILKNLKRLMRNVSGPNAPDAEELPDLAADWSEVLDFLDDEALTAAVVAHLRDPEKGRFWPTPADILAQVPGPTMDDDEVVWDCWMTLVGRGEYSLRNAADDRQWAALEAIGGVWAIRNAEPITLGALRKRWLAHVRQGTSQRAREVPAIAARDSAFALTFEQPRRIGRA